MYTLFEIIKQATYAQARKQETNLDREHRLHVQRMQSNLNRTRQSGTHCIAYSHHTKFVEKVVVNVDEINCGLINKLCKLCGAFHIDGELPQHKKFTNCCQ